MMSYIYVADGLSTKKNYAFTIHQPFGFQMVKTAMFRHTSCQLRWGEELPLRNSLRPSKGSISGPSPPEVRVSAPHLSMEVGDPDSSRYGQSLRQLERTQKEPTFSQHVSRKMPKLTNQVVFCCSNLAH